MQDIAGCRVEVDNIAEQDRVMADLVAKFPDALVQDRRLKPSHGYRAVHLVVDIHGCFVEIQVRTSLQHGWASAVERLTDTIEGDIKYGGGPEGIQDTLTVTSDIIAKVEAIEIRLRQLHEQGHVGAEMDRFNAEMLSFKRDLHEVLGRIIIFDEQGAE